MSTIRSLPASLRSIGEYAFCNGTAVCWTEETFARGTGRIVSPGMQITDENCFQGFRFLYLYELHGRFTAQSREMPFGEGFPTPAPTIAPTPAPTQDLSWLKDKPDTP